MFYNSNLDLVDINAYTKFGEILSDCSGNIELERNYDRWNCRQKTDGMTDNPNLI